MRKVIVAAALVAGVLGAAEARAQQHAQYYEFVDKVQANSDGYLYIRAGGNLTAAHGCTEPWFARSLLPLTNELTKAQMQVALASFLSRSKVYVATIGCTGGGRNGNPILTTIQIEQ